jgi:hypothetical protein
LGRKVPNINGKNYLVSTLPKFKIQRKPGTLELASKSLNFSEKDVIFTATTQTVIMVTLKQVNHVPVPILFAAYTLKPS